MKLNVRFLAATNKDLQKAVREEKFRADLYHRLNVFPILIPPLRDRPEDIPLLVRHCVMKCNLKYRKRVENIRQTTMEAFCAYRWPGNVRELENVVERIVVLARGNEVTVQDLPEFLRQERGGADALEIDLAPQGISLEAVEKELILKALEKCGWNQTRAARYLDISRKTLIYRMERHGIRKAENLQASS